MRAEIIEKELSFEIVNAAFEVHNQLGPSFLESIYEAAMVLALAIVINFGAPSVKYKRVANTNKKKFA